MACHAQGSIPKTEITVFAAASLSDVVTEITKQYESLHPVQVKSAFASSSTIAKQISNGAPADIVIVADTKWMQFLQSKKAIKQTSRKNLLGNRLVIIAPKTRPFKIEMKKTFNFASAFKGRLCTGQTESVPAGIYAKQALMSFGWWKQLKTRIVGTRDVRAALAYVGHGECNAGIVYATDAKVSKKVRTIATFPKNSHAPIVYPLALTKHAKPQAQAFYDYLSTAQAKATFKQYGFINL